MNELVKIICRVQSMNVRTNQIQSLLQNNACFKRKQKNNDVQYKTFQKPMDNCYFFENVISTHHLKLLLLKI